MSSYVVVGASRGIGLEYVRQLAEKQDALVFAIVRNTSSPYLQHILAEHSNLHVIQADVMDPHAVERAAMEMSGLSGGSLDVLIHNAARTDMRSNFRGFNDYKDLDELDSDFIDSFKVNTLGVVHSIHAFLPLLRRGTEKKIIVLNTEGASVSLTLRSGAADVAAYCTTKAAAAMVTAKYAAAPSKEGFVVVSIAPGVVDTSATSADDTAAETFQRIVERMAEAGFRPELLTPAQSVAKQLKVIEGLTQELNGALVSNTGDVIPY
ncbi:NAD(P)-binding protein [Trametes sanguinea]|nr:NAD(P)-binding protein [Trametes sanguinea]